MKRLLNVTFNASGAFQAAKRGDIVVVVDVIDMSTTAEGLISMGAVAVLGAAPDGLDAYHTNPYRIGCTVGIKGVCDNLPILVVSEPRIGSEGKRMQTASPVIRGIQDSGGEVTAILPNVGASIVDCDIIQNALKQGFIAVLVTASGGVCYDVAYNNGAACVLTATTARISGKSGQEIVESVVKRIMSVAAKLQSDITIVAASSQALEDIHASQCIADCIIRNGFLKS